jgi:N-methylhydantoinase A
MGEPPLALVGVDVGGTFTDAVVVAGGTVHTAKVPTTPADQGDGVVRAVLAALQAAGLAPDGVTRIAHGMTVGTNAMLEGTGARTALVATDGLEDVLELRRQDRASLYRLDQHHPAPLVPASRVVPARERMGPAGVVTPLSQDALDDVVSRVRATDPDAVAVGLLFSYAHPAHEQAIATRLRHELPGVHVCASSDVLPEVREYERIATTALDAYLTPVLADYLAALGTRAQAAGLPEPVIMQSSGGVMPLADAAMHASRTVLSGPAGAVVGAADVARVESAAVALAFDMGGTSCDVALIEHGVPGRARGSVVAGHPVHLPMLDIETVSAGGGSIAWADAGGALRVGPRSAGAEPGPAAYGRGGGQATVTDANVVLGRLSGELGLGDTITLDRGPAERAVDALAADLGLSRDDCAQGILDVAVQEMVSALHVVSVERGIDPRGGVLIALGGAGPLHACAVAEGLGMNRITCPATAGVLAALGMVVAGERRDHVQGVLLPVAPGSGLGDAVRALIDRAAVELPGARIEVAADCRYVGQSHSLTVPWDPSAPEMALASAFHDAHARTAGRAMPDAPVEAVAVRVAAVTDGPDVDLHARGEPVSTHMGPVGLPMAGSTCWVAPGWTARVHDDGTVRMERT